MKQIVKPVTPHMVLLNSRETIWDHRPSVITQQDYVDARIGKGEIRVLEQELPDTANDADFLKLWEEHKRDDKAAIAAFMGTLKPAKK